MADEAGPSGRGGGKPRKAKFAPTVPSRRKKAENGPGAAPSAAEAAAANEAFQDLIRAAQSESKWERGRGRGFGRGRGGMGPQQVTFGGGDEGNVRPVGRVPPPARLPGLRTVQLAGGGSAAKKESKVKVKSDLKPGDGLKPADGRFADGSDGLTEDDAEVGPMFDYGQYYPSSLPLGLHHPEDDAADPGVDEALMRSGVPGDLMLRQDDPEASAVQLGLTDLSAAQDLLYLLQLPPVLPLASTAASVKSEPAAAEQRAHRKGAAAGSGKGGGTSAAAAAAPAQQQQPAAVAAAAGIKDLPSGKIGKLLIFKSGKVRMQIGGVLLDVTAGMPCVTRLDVAAVNTSTGHLVQLGPVTQRAVVCPDVWQLMADADVPRFPTAADLQQQRQHREQQQLEVQMDVQQRVATTTNGSAAAAGKGRGKGQEVEQEGADGMEVDGVDGESEGQEEDDEIEDEHESEESGSAEGDGEQQQGSEQPVSAAEVKHEQQQLQQQEQQPVGDGMMGLLGLPAGAAASAGAARGRGKFAARPAARPSSTRTAAKKVDGMDVDK